MAPGCKPVSLDSRLSLSPGCRLVLTSGVERGAEGAGAVLHKVCQCGAGGAAPPTPPFTPAPH